MLRRKDRGTRKTRRTLVFLVFAVLLLADMMWAARAHLEHRRYAQELARKAAETAKKREADSSAHLDQARQALPADAPIPHDWTVQQISDAFEPLQRTDLKLLTKLAQAAVTRDAEARQRNYEVVRTHVQAALQGSATDLERAIAEHIDSQTDVVRIAFDYIVRFQPLRDAEQALDRHLFQLQTDSDAETAYTLGDLATLRGSEELWAGKAREAMESTLHAYEFYQATRTGSLAAFSYYRRGARCERADWLFERIADAVWKETPLSDSDRERAIAVIGGRPSKDELVEDFYALAAADPADMFGSPDSGSYLAYVPKSMAAPVRTRGSEELIGRLAPLMGLPAYEHDKEWKEALRRTPKWADATRSMWDTAKFANETWCARGTRAELTRAAFQLKDYRRSHGEYPEQPIAPLPCSPVTGKNYEYTRTDKGFVIRYFSERMRKTETAWEAIE